MSTFVMLLMGMVAASILAAIVLLPFFTPDPDAAVSRAPTRGAARGKKQYAYETLWAEKQRVLRALRDLDTDYDMHKLPDTIYTEQRVSLIRLYAALVGRMDELEIEFDAQRDRLEAALAAYRDRR